MNTSTDPHMTKLTNMPTTRQTDTNFKKNLAQAVSYNHGFELVGVSVFELESGKLNMDGCMHTQNGQMDSIVLCIYTQPNISIYYRTQSPI